MLPCLRGERTAVFNRFLVSSTQEEEWQEVASQMDSLPTYETEAYQSQARRKYAAAKGVPFEAVTLKDDKDAKATNRKPNKRKVPKDFEEAPDEDAKTTEKDKKGKTEKDNKKEPAKPKAKAKAKQEGTVKEAETAARTAVLQIQRASQTVERLQAALHGEWAAPLMKEFDSLQAALKMQVTPTDGDGRGMAAHHHISVPNRWHCKWILPASKNSQTDEKEPPRSLSLRVLFFRADFLEPLGLASASIETALNMLSILLARSSILG
ncbi:Npr1 [Symbiodinium sp. CCMP2592]|nr:Npr1 [Symbiodinium sp. CCMP2592]